MIIFKNKLLFSSDDMDIEVKTFGDGQDEEKVTVLHLNDRIKVSFTGLAYDIDDDLEKGNLPGYDLVLRTKEGIDKLVEDIAAKTNPNPISSFMIPFRDYSLIAEKIINLDDYKILSSPFDTVFAFSDIAAKQVLVKGKVSFSYDDEEIVLDVGHGNGSDQFVLLKSNLQPKETMDGLFLGLIHDAKKEISSGIELMPKDLVSILDRHVAGQSYAKRKLTTHVIKHYKTIGTCDKENIILIGETGVGKTTTVKQLAKALDRPYYIADTPSFTAAGYQGNSASDLLRQLWVSSGKDKSKAENGIIFLEEIAGIVVKETGQRDIKGEDMQRELLKITEGHKVPINIGDNMSPHYIEIDTSNILFICGGNIPGLKDKVVERKGSETEWYKHIQAEDLVKSGFIPEFVGRLPVIVGFDGLRAEDFEAIMKLENSVLNQYKRLFSENGTRLLFDDDDVRQIANNAFSIKGDMGARGLQAYVSNLMEDLLYDAFSGGLGKEAILKDKIPKNL